MHPFQSADILIPKSAPLEKWAVIACDQFVSQPAYWQQVRGLVGSAPSSLQLILPEAELENDTQGAITRINQTMTAYLQSDVFACLPDSFIYVERTLLDGTVRTGVVGVVDLEQYDYTPGSDCAIRATEKTVAERVPPRMDIRREAPLELPHVLLLCDDEEQQLIETLGSKQLPMLYDFELMAGGGRIRGWLAAGESAADFRAALERYEQRMTEKYGPKPVLYAVGDGNHSLAAAKGCYEELKKQDPSLPENHPARYALVELENIHHTSQVFEPIHRIIKNTDPAALLGAMEQTVCRESGSPVTWYMGGQQGTVYVRSDDGQLPVGVVQSFLDDYLKDHPGIIDYIHGDDAVRELSGEEHTLGLLLPPVEKKAFFQGIISGGTLPRKTFSMGHAQEKRYYLEARKIK